jgi:hypothetical protein
MAIRSSAGTACLMTETRLVETVVALSEMPVNIAARARQRIDEAGGERIAGPEGDHRGHIRLLAGQDGRIAGGHDHVDPLRHHGADNLRQPDDLTVRPARCEDQIFPGRIAALLQAVEQDRRQRVCLIEPRPRHQRADAKHLCPHGEEARIRAPSRTMAARHLRRRLGRAGNRHAGNQPDEFAPSHARISCSTLASTKQIEPGLYLFPRPRIPVPGINRRLDQSHQRTTHHTPTREPTCSPS